MPDLFYLVSKWWKQMLLLVILSLAVVTTILYLQPVKYLSEATALPSSTYASDKSSIFNNNIQQLYPALGTTDDLDMIVGTAQLDTVYIAVADSFNIGDHYRVSEEGYAATLKGALILKQNTKVMKSDFGELKVKVWDTDKNLAPQLANAIMNKLQAIHQDLQNNNNLSILNKLQSGRDKLLKQIDSISIFLRHSDITSENAAAYTSRRNALYDQLQQYEKLIGQYELMVDARPASMVIVERARAANWPDRPKKLPLLAATFFLSILFAMLLALLLEKRKK